MTTMYAIIGIVVAVAVAVFAVANRYKIAQPHEAFIVTGRGDTANQKVVIGAGVFVVPLVQQVTVISLKAKQIPLHIEDAKTKQGVPLQVEAVATIKVRGDENGVRAAAQRFDGGENSAIAMQTKEALEGELRAAIGASTVEDIMTDRDALQRSVREAAGKVLSLQGLDMDAFSIKELKDAGNGTYLRDFGRPQAARVKQEAEVAEATSHRIAEQARIEAEQQLANSNRELDLRKAAIRTETDAAAAAAAAAGPRAAAEAEQEVIKVQARVEAERAALTEQQLATEINKPADAAAYQQRARAQAEADAATIAAEARTTQAEAEARALIIAAEAQAKKALADADATRADATAARDSRNLLAEATRIEGEAAAAAVSAMGAAEAEALDKKSDAYAKFNGAAIAESIIKVLPEVAEKLAAPMSNIDNLTVISSEGAGALPKTVTNNMVQTMDMVKSATGLDLAEIISSLTSSKGTVAPAAEQLA